MKQKSILVRLLSVVCMVCCCLGLVFGLAACGETEEEPVKAIQSITMETNGDLTVIYTNGDRETVKNNKTEITICAHDEIWTMEDDMNVTLESLIKAEMEDPSTFDPKTLSADRCRIEKMGICKDCGEFVATYVGHKEKIDNQEATCTLGSYTGVACEFCSWTEGNRNEDAKGHDYAAVADPIEFQEGLLGRKVNKCVDVHYTSVEICKTCGFVKVEKAKATGHTFDKAALVESKIDAKDDVYTLSGVCKDCSTPAVVVELPKLADGDYAVVSGGSKDETGHKVAYKFTGTADIKVEGAKFSDGSTTYEFDAKTVTTDSFVEAHYITKGEEKVEPYGKVLADYAAGVYNNLFIDSNAAPLTCDAKAAGTDATAVCEFCNTSVPTTVKKAHTYPEKEEDKVVSYTVVDGGNPCTEAHKEIWKCNVCGEHEVANVAPRGHAYVLDESRQDKGVEITQDGKVNLYFVCLHDATHTDSDLDVEGVECVVEETCGAAGEYYYIDANGEKHEFTKPATGLHVYEAGKVVEYKNDNVVEYAIAKEYINKSVYLASTNATVVCGQNIEASLICPDCKQSVAIMMNRAHVLDEEHSQAAAQTCVGTAYAVKYCAYADCANKYVDGKNDTPYFSDALNARHTLVFDRIEGGQLYVKCTVANCPAKETAFAVGIAADLLVADKCVDDKLCADYAKGEYNYNVYAFEYAIAGNDAEAYEVIEKLAVDAHKYGVTENMPVIPGVTPNASAIINDSYLSSDSAAEDCQHQADYDFICKDCNLSVAIKVYGSHVNTDGEVEDATCEEAAYWLCDAEGCNKTKVYVEGSKPTGHNEKVVVNADKNSAHITCEDCDLDITVAITDTGVTAGAAVNCEDCIYTYEYKSEKVVGYKETFTFVAKKIGGTSHELLEDKDGNNVVFCYVIVDGEAVLYDPTNEDHYGLAKYCGNFCTKCGAFVNPPIA